MRNQFFHRGLVLIAGFIFCLHTIYPHVHSSDGVEEELSFTQATTDARSLLDLLCSLVEADLGEEHLEHFTASDLDASSLVVAVPSVVIHPPVTFYLPVVAPAADQIKGLRVVNDHPLLPDDKFLLCQRPLRGPPFYG
jgi:hypothetical protein